MSRVIILGQAPSRVGDGRPFSGPSGARLCGLAGLRNYEELALAFDLRNLIQVPAPKTDGKGDSFDLALARESAFQMYRRIPDQTRILCCGNLVWEAMGMRPKNSRYYYWTPLRARVGCTVHLARFPHPSGVSHYWNAPERVRAAAAFLAPLVTRE